MTGYLHKQEISNDQLICSITLQLFHYPVKPNDGHVYQREAITKSILQHGTSPLTRQPLNINDPQPYDYLRNLSRQQRNSSVSYNCLNEKVIFSPLKYLSRTNLRINPQIDNETVRNI
jgi:U-box domain